MINMTLFADGLKCKWVKLYLDDSVRNWKVFFDHVLMKYGGKFLFHCNFAKGDVVISNPFINNVCDAWASYNFYVPVDDNCCKQFVLNNHYIKIDNGLFFSKSLKNSSAFRVCNFINHDGTSVSYVSFVNKYHVYIPFTIYFGIIHAIPIQWKHSRVENFDIHDQNLRLFTFLSASRPGNFVYNSLLKSSYIAPAKAVAKWDIENIHIPADWSSIFMLPYRITKYSKIHYFQYRILHRIIGVNNLLYKMKIVDSPLCTFCKHEYETIVHLFWKCPLVKTFWDDCNTVILLQPFNINDSIVVFGYFDNVMHPINLFLLHAKYYIFSCRASNTIPNVHSFHRKFCHVIEVHLYIHKERVNAFESFIRSI